MAIPQHSEYLIIGAGIHGLSTAYHLALELKAKGKGDGSNILVVDKTSIGAGASGIACGVVRNNYFQPAMRELMAQCVEVWESDAKAYSYHAVGYMQISPDSMFEDVASIAEQQKEIGYESVFIEGEKASAEYMKGKEYSTTGRLVKSLQYFTRRRAGMQTIPSPCTDWLRKPKQKVFVS
jgi:glycine/D-amino acid oxidase-like deaminating enzyme